MRARTSFFAVAVLLLVACSSDKGSETTGVTTTSVAASTSSAEPTTTAGGGTTSTAPTSAPATTTSPTTIGPVTTVVCTPKGDTAKKESADPLAMSGLVGVDIRTGAHPCFERVVIELGGTGDFPGWGVSYVDDPVTLGESEETVYIEGDATLLVRMGMWMPDMEGNGWSGPTQFFPTNVSHITELRQIENWEGVSIWTIGLDGTYPFTVDVYNAPYRLVIDIYVG